MKWIGNMDKIKKLAYTDFKLSLYLILLSPICVAFIIILDLIFPSSYAILLGFVALTSAIIYIIIDG